MKPSSNPQEEANTPFVSIITPTYNRARFIPILIECVLHQDYPKHRMEWIVYDDGSEPVEHLFKNVKKVFPNFKYIYNEEKLNIGAKRNRLNKESTGSIIVAFDDDDYYPPQRVSHVIQKFKQNPTYELAGSSEIYMYYTDIKTIYCLGPYNKNHATNGTMAWRKSYALKNSYDETVTHAEEKSFLESYRNPMIQLDPMKVMLVMSHDENTFNKIAMREQTDNPFVKKTHLKLNYFIKQGPIRKFYADLK
jgi:glycosyltransferase involved in cell wall biosynthesis